MSDVFTCIGIKSRKNRYLFSIQLYVGLLLLTGLLPKLNAQQVVHEDLDNYKFRVAGFYWFANPSGNLSGSTQAGVFPIDHTTGFGEYSTFLAAVDWKFKRKHHFLFAVSPNTVSQSKLLTETLTFQGKTYEAGAAVSTQLRTLSFAPGYEYDIIRRKRGHLGIVVQINLLDIKGSIQAAAGASGPNQTISQSSQASGSLFAPLPLIGPEGKLFLSPHSNRMFAEGSVKGLYFFGYGDFITAEGTLGIKVTQALDLKVGYQLGNRLVIHGSTDRIGVRLTQDGPIVGLQYRW